MHLAHDPREPAAAPIDFDAFLAVDIRVGTVVEASAFPEAQAQPGARHRVRSGHRRTGARITEHDAPEDVVGRQVAAVVNVPPRQIGRFPSRVPTLGFAGAAGAVMLFRPDRPVPDGSRLF